MASNYSEEVRDQHLAVFGSELGPVYSALSADVVWLHSKWIEYRKLFAQSPDRIGLLNDMAPYFFGLLQDVLWRDTLLHMARLTDPPQQGPFENLSLLCLNQAPLDAQLKQRVAVLTKRSVVEAAFARDYRNKHLAHNDLQHALGRATPLPLGSREKVEDVLATFAETLNAVSQHYGGSTMLYREAIGGLGDANALVGDLALAAQVEAQRRQRAEAGTSLPEDFSRPAVP